MILKYIPNFLTVVRLLLIVPFLFYLHEHAYRFALVTFLIAGVTDGFDGWLARYFNWQSFFGSFVDPLADKLLVAASFISLALIGSLPWWLVVVVFLRDFTISMGVLAWYRFIGRGIHFEPTRLSKLNTILQLILVIMCLLELAYFQLPYHATEIFIALTAVTTATTYLDYLWSWGKKACLMKEVSE